MSSKTDGLTNYAIMQEVIQRTSPEEFACMREISTSIGTMFIPEILKQSKEWDRLDSNKQGIVQKLAESVAHHSLEGYCSNEIEKTAEKIHNEMNAATNLLNPSRKAADKRLVQRRNAQQLKILKSDFKNNVDEVSGSCVSVMSQLMPSVINDIREKILAAKECHCHPKEISAEKLADTKMQALLKEEAEKKAERNIKRKQDATKGKKKPSHPPHVQQNQKGKKISQQTKATQNAPSDCIKTSFEKKELTDAQTIQIGQNFFKTSSCPQLLRVTRWATESLNDIRQFSDTDQNGGQIFKYAEKSDEEIIFQRTCHYLPGTEHLLTDSNFREIYAFQTEQGYGMVAQLIVNDKALEGAIYFGMTQAHAVFHKKFDVRDFQHENVFIEKEATHHSEENDKEGEWKSQKYDFTLDVSKEGILTFTYSKNHLVKIFPIFSEKLPEIGS